MTVLRERQWPLLARLLRDHLLTIADADGALVGGNVEALHTVLGPHVEGGERVTAELAFLWRQGELYADDGLVHVRKGAARKRTAAAERKARQRERERQRQLELGPSVTTGVTLPVTPGVTEGRDIDSVTGRDIPPASPSPLTLPSSSSPSLDDEEMSASVPTTDQEPSAEPSVTTGVTGERDIERDATVRCPSDLKLTAEQFASLHMNIGIDQKSADLLAAKFTAKMLLEEPRTLTTWLKCLSTAISRDWNAGARPLKQNAGPRPAHRQPDSGYDPFAAAEDATANVTRVTGSQ